MVKQKRKGPKVTEKDSKKQKKASAEEVPCTPEARPDREEPSASPKEVAASKEQGTGPELSPEERRALERKQKKERKKEERKRLREAGVAAAQAPPARPSAAELALDYLSGWAQKHKSWKFQKTRQTWLLLHMYDGDQVPDKHFGTLLAYLEGLKGSARELTVRKAEALMQEMDEVAGDAALLGKAQRLRQVLQLLS